MSILLRNPVAKYQNYIKTKCYPEHLAVLHRFENIKYTKYKNQYVDYSELLIPTSLGFIYIEHNVYKSINANMVEITMVFIESSVRYSFTDATMKPTVQIEELGSEIRYIL